VSEKERGEELDISSMGATVIEFFENRSLLAMEKN